MKKLLIILLISAAIANSGFIDASKPIGDQTTKEMKNLTASDILARAFQYLGVNPESQSCKKARVEYGMAKRENITFPFVHDRLMNDSVWHVTVPDVRVGSSRTPIERNFELYLDPADGTLLRIYSLCENVGSSDTLSKLNAEKSAISFNARRFPYDGIPTYIPKVSFLMALDQCVLDPASAKELEGYFIDHSGEKGPESDIWLVVIRGSELLLTMMGAGAKANDTPDRLRNGAICRISAATGELLGYRNLPQDMGEKK